MKKNLLMLLSVCALGACNQINTGEAGNAAGTTNQSNASDEMVGGETARTADDSITLETATGMDTTATGGKASHGAAADPAQGTQAQ